MAYNTSKITKPQSRKKFKEYRSTNKTHLKEILFTLLILHMYFSEDSKNHIKTASVENMVIPNISNNSIFTLTRKSNFSKNPKNIILLLIILSNDVNPNPGPPKSNKQETKCYTCNSPMNNKSQYLKCTTCKHHYHLTCQKLTKSKQKADYFEWICPTRKCPPNHENALKYNHFMVQNRYTSLDQETCDIDILYEETQEIVASQRETTHIPETDLTPSELLNKALFQELTPISPKDFGGKYLCRVCYKEVKEKHRAISCDLCEAWSHLKCCDMSVKLYNHFKCLQNFEWTCTKCRKDEKPISDKIDVTQLPTDQLPDNLAQVKASRKEILIVHLNCRSVINKQEEIENIIHETDADLICLSETWMDDSVPLQALTPVGYKMIRKDRHHDFKQKYGKNKGGGVALLYKEQINVERKDYLTEDLPR